MTHYFKDENGNSYNIEMYCSHPNRKNNSSGSIGCDGRCEECSYGRAETSIKEMLSLIDLADVTL